MKADNPSGDTHNQVLADAIDEREIVRKFAGDVAWPTVILCVVLTVTYIGVLYTWSADILPLWVGFIANTVLTYMFYTVHHDANHKSISGRQARWAWLDTTLGSIAAIPLHLSFKGWSAEHLRHHGHTNDPLHDPDAIVAGPLLALPIKWVAAVVLGVISDLPYGEGVAQRIIAPLLPPDLPEPTERIKLEQRRLRRFSQAGLVVLVTSIPLGFFVPVFFLWWLPGKVGGLALMFLFQWLPHVPYDSTARFRNTRIATFRGSTWLLLQQDRHLIHHLYPTVPWYRYRALFQEVRPLLEAEGARIEGRDSTPHQPIVIKYEATEIHR